MAEDIPVTERRRVVIEYVVNGPPWQKPAGGAADAGPLDIAELTRAVRRELIRTGYRNLDIFGGRA